MPQRRAEREESPLRRATGSSLCTNSAPPTDLLPGRGLQGWEVSVARSRWR